LIELHWGSGLRELARNENKCGIVNEAECAYALTSVIACVDSETNICALLVGATQTPGLNFSWED